MKLSTIQSYFSKVWSKFKGAVKSTVKRSTLKSIMSIFIYSLLCAVGAFVLVLFASSIIQFEALSSFLFENVPGANGELSKLIAQLIGGIAIIIGVFIANKRANEMRKGNLLIEKGNTSERFKNAIEHLGHKESTIILGGIYTLHQIAKSYKEDYREQVFEVLCSFIRVRTNEKNSNEKQWHELSNEEKETYRPPIEIQTILDILFKQKNGIYFYEGLNADLTGANLQKVDLSISNLQSAILSFCNLQEADLWAAELIGSHLYNANFQGSNMEDCKLQKAQLINTNFQGATLVVADFTWAFIIECRFQGVKMCGAILKAELVDINFQGADLHGADFREAYLEEVNFQGADLGSSKFQLSFLEKVNFKGSNLSGANLIGAGTWVRHKDSIKFYYASVGKDTKIDGAINGVYEEEIANYAISNIDFEVMLDKSKVEIQVRIMERVGNGTNINDAKQGIFTKEDAEEIIAERKKYQERYDKGLYGFDIQDIPESQLFGNTLEF